jgi:hypothetical protein
METRLCNVQAVGVNSKIRVVSDNSLYYSSQPLAACTDNHLIILDLFPTLKSEVNLIMWYNTTNQSIN